MTDYRALAHGGPSRAAIASNVAGWIAAAACSLAAADSRVAAESPSGSGSPPVVAPLSVQLTVQATTPSAAAPAPGLTQPSEAAATPPARSEAEGSYFVEAGIGQTFGPSTFLLSATACKFVDSHLAIGPTLQLGIDDDETIFAPTFGVRRAFDLDSADLHKVEPYLEGGVGFAYLEDDRRGGDDDDLGFLLTFGLGANVQLQPNLALGTGVLVNLMPGEVLDERLFVSWRILQLQFAF